MKNFNYHLTYHAIERFQERFPVETSENINISRWNRSKNISSVKDFFNIIIENSNENKSYFNNTKYMIHIFEQYGYENDYKFLENNKLDILLVMTKSRSEDEFTLVTVMPTSFKKKHSLAKNKFNKKLTKEKIQDNKFLNLFNDVKKQMFIFENEHLHPIVRIRDLEKQNNYDIFHKTALLNILNILDCKKYSIQINKNLKIFKSENFEYQYQIINNELSLLKIGPNTTQNKSEVKKYFNLILEIHDRLSESIVLKNVNDYISERELLINEKKCIFKYNSLLDKVESYQFVKLNLDDSKKYSLEDNTEKCILQKIKKNHFIILSKINFTHLLCQTQIDNYQVIFKYNVNNSQIIVENIKSMLPENLNLSSHNLNAKLIDLVNLQKTEIIEDLSWNKKVRTATVNGYDIKFIHINGQKETVITSISEIQPISLYSEHSQPIKSVDDTSIQKTINFNKDVFKRFKNIN